MKSYGHFQLLCLKLPQYVYVYMGCDWDVTVQPAFTGVWNVEHFIVVPFFLSVTCCGCIYVYFCFVKLMQIVFFLGGGSKSVIFGTAEVITQSMWNLCWWVQRGWWHRHLTSGNRQWLLHSAASLFVFPPQGCKVLLLATVVSSLIWVKAGYY